MVIHGSAIKELIQIPRASSLDLFACSTKYYDGSFTVKYTPKVGNYCHRLRISVLNQEVVGCIYLCGGEAYKQSSLTFKLTSEQMNILLKHVKMDSPYVQIGAVVETYSSSDFTNKIGESQEKILNIELPCYWRKV